MSFFMKHITTHQKNRERNKHNSYTEKPQKKKPIIV